MNVSFLQAQEAEQAKLQLSAYQVQLAASSQQLSAMHEELIHSQQRLEVTEGKLSQVEGIVVKQAQQQSNLQERLVEVSCSLLQTHTISNSL